MMTAELPEVVLEVFELARDCSADEASHGSREHERVLSAIDDFLAGEPMSGDAMQVVQDEFLAYMDNGFTDESRDRRAINRFYHETWGLERYEHGSHVLRTHAPATCTIGGVRYEAVAVRPEA